MSGSHRRSSATQADDYVMPPQFNRAKSDGTRAGVSGLYTPGQDVDAGSDDDDDEASVASCAMHTKERRNSRAGMEPQPLRPVIPIRSESTSGRLTR